VGPVVQKLRQALLLVEGQRPAEERERRPPRVRSVQSGVASLRAAVRCRSRPGQRQASIMQLVWLKDIATESMMDEYCNRSATNSAPTQGNHPRRKILLPYYGRYSGRAHSLGRSNEEQAFSLVQGFVLPPRSVLFVREQTRQLFVHFLFVTRSHLESSSASPRTQAVTSTMPPSFRSPGLSCSQSCAASVESASISADSQPACSAKPMTNSHT